MKVKILIFGFVFIFMISWLTLSLDIQYSNNTLGIKIPALSDVDYNFVFGLFTTYWSLVTFNVIGMPYIVNVIFLIINMILLFVVLSDILIPMLRSNPWVLLGVLILGLLSTLIVGIINFIDPIKDFFDGIINWISSFKFPWQ